MLPNDGKGYLFGLVARDDLLIHGGAERLLYIYTFRSGSKQVNKGDVSKENLLLPPLLTNELGWRYGVFDTIAHWDLDVGDTYLRHCLYDPVLQVYVDEFRHPLPSNAEASPCGSLALSSYRRIDDMISSALGVPTAPPQPGDELGQVL